MGEFFGTIAAKLVEVVLPTLATAIAGLVVVLLRKWSQKAGLDLTEQQEQRIRQIVVDAIARAEEIGRRETLSSEDKRTIATQSVRRQVRDLTDSQIAELVDSTLPAVRATLVPKTPATLGRLE